METNLPITHTKILIPRRKEELIARERLIHIMDDAIDNRLIIIAAPAGYGKTSLLVDFVNQTVLPVCWLSLDPLDRDPQRLISHLIFAIQQKFNEFGKSCISALEKMRQDNLNLDSLVSLIVNDAFEAINEHFIVVLEDYHLVEDNSDINYFINRFLMSVDENCHLIISSRRLLPLPDMPLLVARGQVGGLGFEELAFTNEEIRELYLQNHHVTLSDREAETLAKLTEGWITGLMLSTQISRGRVLHNYDGKKIAGVGLYDYLAQQVLQNQPDDLQLFLFRTSLLEEFDADLCDKVIGKSLGIAADWKYLMEQLQRKNLFVLPLVEDRLWLRYHHLFRDFLQNKMKNLYPEETQKIYFQLALHYSQVGEWDLAYQVYQSIGSQNEIASMISNAGPVLVSHGRLLTLRQWLDALPKNYLEKSPELLSLQGVARVMLGYPKNGIKLLCQAVQLLEIGTGIDVLALTLVRRSGAYKLIGSYELALEDAEKAIQITKNQPALESISAGAYYSKGSILFHKGDLNKALDSLLLAKTAFQAIGDHESASKTAMEIALVSRHLGQYAAAEELYKEVLDYYQSTGNIVWQANLLNNLGVLHILSGDYEAALNELERSVEYAKLGGYLRLEGYAMVSLGDLFKDIKAYKEANEAYNNARAVIIQVNDKLLDFYLEISLSELDMERGRFHRAKDHIEAAYKIGQETNSQFEQYLCKIQFGKLEFLHKEISSAIQEIEEALQFFKKEGHHVEVCKCMLLLGLAYLANGDLESAKKQINEVIVYFRNSKLISLLANLKPIVEIAKGKLHETGVEEAAYPPLFSELCEYVDSFGVKLPGLRKLLRRRSQIILISPPELTITTFGKIQVKIGEHVISGMEWMSQNARDLMLLLLMHPEGMTKEEVGAIFWPDSSPAELRVRFKNTIYRLRHAAGKDVVVYIDDTYSFNRGMDYEADFETFDREISLAKHSKDIASQIDHYRKAYKLYKGIFLPEIDEEWVYTDRERYHQMFHDGTAKLAELLLEQGEFSNAIAITAQMLVEDSCNEHMVRIAMRAHAALGHQAAVVRQYDMCAQALKEEYGTRPSLQTVSLYETLSRGRHSKKQSLNNLKS